MAIFWIISGFLVLGSLGQGRDPMDQRINKGFELVQKASQTDRYRTAPVRLIQDPAAAEYLNPRRKIAPPGLPQSARLEPNLFRRTDKFATSQSEEYEQSGPVQHSYSTNSAHERLRTAFPDKREKLMRLQKIDLDQSAEYRSAEKFERFRDPQSYYSPKKQANEYQPPQPQPPPPPLDFTYHNYTVMTEFLQKIVLAYPHLTKLYSIGKSVQGRDLWVVLLTTEAHRDNIGRPQVKIVGNIHGNEAVGREVSLHMIEYLLVRYSTEPYVKWLLDHTRVHILPSLNPDGFEVSREGACYGGQGRYNAMGFDLNRNFPDYFKTNMKQPQPETEAYKAWLARESFVLSASLHGGALVVSYPFDNTPNAITQPFVTSPALTPDNDVLKYLATSYASTHPTMHLGLPCKPGAPTFQNGTVNGASWYPLIGGAQDYNYIWGGCLEVTVEMTCCKFPPAAELPGHWEDHRSAILQLLGEARRGVRGMMSDMDGIPIPSAEMRISGRDVGFKSSTRGEYWRLLLPGDYTIEVYKEGFEPREIEFTVNDNQPTILNIALRKIKRIEPVSNSIDINRRQSQPARRPQPQTQTVSAPTEKQEEAKGPFLKFTKTLASFFGR